MKTRQGFVSNSSSTSFIVAFPEIPKDSEHIMKLAEISKEMADFIWCDVKDATPNDMEEISRDLYIPALPLPWMFRLPSGDIDWEKYTNEIKRILEDSEDSSEETKFLSMYKTWFLYRFEYGNSWTPGDCWNPEDGEHFGKLPKLDFNHH